MKKSILAAMLLLMFAVPFARGGGAQETGDLEQYIQSIRDKGMAEWAEADLRTLASILSGGSLLTFVKQDGSERLWNSYRSTSCPDPNADPEARAAWREREMAKANEIIARLKPLADEDASGFVSNVEGRRFRGIVEHGYLCAEVAKSPHADTALLAEACGLSLEQAVSRLDEYKATRVQLLELGFMDLPDVPTIPPATSVAGESR